MTEVLNAKTCPFANGCPFRECENPEEMLLKLRELADDPIWRPFLAKMKGCPLFNKCPMADSQKDPKEQKDPKDPK